MTSEWDIPPQIVSLLQATLRTSSTPALAPAGPADQDAFPILNIVVPHSPQLPRVAVRPFFIVTGWPSWISRLSQHLMQYPVIGIVPSFLTSQKHAAGIYIRRPGTS